MTAAMGMTQGQKDALDYITHSITTTGVSPSYDDIRRKLSLKSTSGVHRLINALEEKGYVHRLPRRAHSLGLGRSPVVCCPYCDRQFQPYAQYRKKRRLMVPA